MGVGEKAAALGKAIHVWGLHTGVSIQATRPIVHVIYADKKDIGFAHRSISLA
jgi:hypothetical protein